MGRLLQSGGIGDRKLYPGNLHQVLFGPSGVGKGMRLLAPILLTTRGKSIVVIDPKGQLAAMTALQRARLGDDVKIIDPFGIIHELVKKRPQDYGALGGMDVSVGFNPLAALDPKSSDFFDDCAIVADALIKIQGHDPHWTESAQGLVQGLVMWQCEQHGRKATLGEVRRLLTEADFWHVETDPKTGKKHAEQVRGLAATAMIMSEYGSFAVQSLAGRFARDTPTDEIESIKSTADTQTRWLLSDAVRADLEKDGIDFASLKTGDRPTTVYVVLPSIRLESHSVWLRLVVSEVLRACMTTTLGNWHVMMILDEFPALGHLSIIQKQWGVTRDYGVSIYATLQDLTQLKRLYPDSWETMLSSAGFVQFFRAGDMTTADWVAKRSPPDTRIAYGHTSGSSQARGGYTSSNNLTTSQIEKPGIPPHKMFELPNEVTIGFIGGVLKPIALYLPHLEQLTDLNRLALKNPYYRG